MQTLNTPCEKKEGGEKKAPPPFWKTSLFLLYGVALPRFGKRVISFCFVYNTNSARLNSGLNGSAIKRCKLNNFKNVETTFLLTLLGAMIVETGTVTGRTKVTGETVAIIFNRSSTREKNCIVEKYATRDITRY